MSIGMLNFSINSDKMETGQDEELDLDAVRLECDKNEFT